MRIARTALELWRWNARYECRFSATAATPRMGRAYDASRRACFPSSSVARSPSNLRSQNSMCLGGSQWSRMIATERDDQDKQQILNLPTILTVGRVAAVPVLISVFFSNQSWSPMVSTGIFVGAAVTDWLDGYLARKMNLSSAFGAFLDPVADKLIVATALILLCTRPLGAPWFSDLGWLVPLQASIIIGREIVVSAIREWAAVRGGGLHKAVAVDNVGKMKTATQMIGVTLLLAFGDAREGVQAYLQACGVGILHLSTALALWSLAIYSRRLFAKISK